MRTKYALTVESRDQAGVEQRARTGYREAYGRYRRGEKVDIRYNPGRPSEFAVDSFGGLWFGPFAWCGIGALACVAFLCGPQRA